MTPGADQYLRSSLRDLRTEISTRSARTVQIGLSLADSRGECVQMGNRGTKRILKLLNHWRLDREIFCSTQLILRHDEAGRYFEVKAPYQLSINCLQLQPDFLYIRDGYRQIFCGRLKCDACCSIGDGVRRFAGRSFFVCKVGQRACEEKRLLFRWQRVAPICGDPVHDCRKGVRLCRGCFHPLDSAGFGAASNRKKLISERGNQILVGNNFGCPVQLLFSPPNFLRVRRSPYCCPCRSNRTDCTSPCGSRFAQQIGRDGIPENYRDNEKWGSPKKSQYRNCKLEPWQWGRFQDGLVCRARRVEQLLHRAPARISLHVTCGFRLRQVNSTAFSITVPFTAGWDACVKCLQLIARRPTNSSFTNLGAADCYGVGRARWGGRMSHDLFEGNQISDGFGNGVLGCLRSKIQDEFVKRAIRFAHPIGDLGSAGIMRDFSCSSVQSVDCDHNQIAQVWPCHGYFGPGQCIDPRDQLINLVDVLCQLLTHSFGDGLTSLFDRFVGFLLLWTRTLNMCVLPHRLNCPESSVRLFTPSDSVVKTDNQCDNVPLQATDTGGGCGNRNQRVLRGLAFSIAFRGYLVCSLRLVDFHCAAVGLSRLMRADVVAPKDGNDRSDRCDPFRAFIPSHPARNWIPVQYHQKQHRQHPEKRHGRDCDLKARERWPIEPMSDGIPAGARFFFHGEGSR